MKLHIWTDEVSYLAVCHADSVADAREMLAVEVGGQDGSCPERAKAWKDISENTSAPYNGRVAAFCLSDSAEVREQLAYSEKVCAERDASRARIAELEAALETKHQQYTGAVIQLAEARKDGEPKGIATWLTDNHVRTKEGKLCCVEVRRPDTHGGMACTYKFNDFDLAAEIEGSEVGEEIVLRYVELTDAEFTALGDFDGW